MYNEHFGLQQAPFRITPDTRMFYQGGGRGEILEALLYAIVSGEGIVKVVGEVGTGKTMLCRMLEERLPENVEIVYMANPSLKPDEILQAIALEMKLNVAPGCNRLTVMHAMQQRLLEKHAAGRQVVVFVEEAQSMPIETLEEIRLLSNLETKHEKLLQIVLFGQPELDHNLNQNNIRQLKERITHSFYLEPLKRNELRDYVNFRMRAVGYRGPDVFRNSASFSMTRASEGLTRRINILADKALLAAYASDRHEVTLKDVRKAINDSRFEARRRRLSRFVLPLGALILTGAAGWGFLESRGTADPSYHLTDIDAALSRGAANPGAAASAATPDAAQAGEGAIRPLPVEETPSQVANQTPEFAGPMGPAGPADAGNVGVAPESAPSGGQTSSAGFQLMAAASRSAAPTPLEPSGTGLRATESIARAPSAGIRDGGTYGATTGDPMAPRSAAGADAPPPDLLAARLAATRQWLARADDSHYSIQLLLTAESQRRHVESFLEQRNREGGIDQVYVYETVIDGRPYLGVLYRDFSAYSAARRALDDLPPDLKRLGPFIRNLRDVSTVG